MITEDGADTAGIAGYCGRLDLAVKLADQQTRYRWVRIFTLDGTEVSCRIWSEKGDRSWASSRGDL